MALYAISDLHLSFYSPKPMDIFDPIWKNHPEKIKKNWGNTVKPEDTILIPGDISWASKLEQAKLDLDYINNLPGKKIITNGNHDYWWSSTNKLNELYENIKFIKNDIITYEKYYICCIRGWVCPNDTYFTQKDEKIYLRETKRLENLLEKVKDKENIIVMMHFSPTNDKLENSFFIDLIKKYKVKKVIYGHIHSNFDICFTGKVNDVEYKLVSADYLKFKPLKLI